MLPKLVRADIGSLTFEAIGKRSEDGSCINEGGSAGRLIIGFAEGQELIALNIADVVPVR